MASRLRIVGLGQPPQRRGEFSIGRLQQMLEVVVDPPPALLRCASSPDQSVEQLRQQLWRVQDKAIHDVGMPGKQFVRAIVVPVSVRSYRQQVLQDGTCCLQASSFQGAVERRYRLRADLHRQHPSGPAATRSMHDRSPQLPRRVHVDGQHDNGGALRDGPNQNAGDEPEGPPEALLHRRFFRRGRVRGADQISHDLDEGGDEGREEVRRDAVGDVAQAQRRHVLDHLLRLPVHLQGHLDDPVRDEMQPCRRLLEEVLALWSHREEALVKPSSELPFLTLGQANDEAFKRTFMTGGFADLGTEPLLDALPQPDPSGLVRRAPILRQEGPQRRQHHGPESLQLHVALLAATLASALREVQRKNVALLLQALSVGGVLHNRFKGVEHLGHPRVAAEAHDHRVEAKHLHERPRDLHVHSVGLGGSRCDLGLGGLQI
mmetsp:Transcript_104577/g.294471  ORF Transcript_104577/g.294471 Transcript_104577/m.294471 type:complete len:433 (-) Transcript_104577:11-1309(-)